MEARNTKKMGRKTIRKSVKFFSKAYWLLVAFCEAIPSKHLIPTISH